jgi:PAS domain S-box-containing protein
MIRSRNNYYLIRGNMKHTRPVRVMISLLYVDDEPDLLEIGKLFLEQTGEITVGTALSAPDALTLLEQHHYDAVLSDYQMPGMDGIRFLQILRGRGDSIPFIIFTGRGREEVIIQALNSGVDFYLQKGGDPGSQFAELANLVRKAVAQKQAAAALVTSEAQYRNILENIQDVYYRSDREGNLVLASPSLAGVLGYDSLAEVLGKNISGVFYYDPDERTRLLAAISEKGSVTDYEVSLKKKDGTRVYVATSSHKYFDARGNYQGVEGIFRDITEKKQAEDQLRLAYEHITAAEEELRAQLEELKYGQDALLTSEKKLQGIVHGSPIPQFVIDKNHRVISWNAALERYSGVKAKDVLDTNQQWRAFYPEERPCMADLLVDGKIEKIPEWYAGKFSSAKYVDGAYEATDFFPKMGASGTWLHFTASPIRDAGGAIIGAVETLQDITDGKRAEEEILSLNRFQQGIIANANVWLMVLDGKGTVLLWNNAAAEISGYPQEEVLHSSAIWKSLYPDKEYRKLVTATILKIIQEKQYLKNFETAIRTRSGDKKTILWNTRSLDETGDRGTTYVAIGVDITKSLKAEQAYRDSENRLAAIVRGSPIPQFVIDRDHKVIQWNAALEKYSGIRADEVIGTNRQWRAFYQEERPCMADLLMDAKSGSPGEWYAGKFTRSALIEGGYEATDFFPHMGPSGTWLHFTAAPIRDPEGTVIGAVETLEDISDAKHAEEALTQINRKLNLMSSVTRHDILNQITALSGFTELLKLRISDPKGSGYLEQCERAIRNIERQITFTKLYQDLGVTSPAWQNAGDLVRQVTSQLAGAPVTIDADLDTVELYADPLLVKVFYNLIDNAQQHGGHLTQIRFSKRKDPDALILICEDDGQGIPEEEKMRIFDRGFGKHTGLGLFLAKEILAITNLSIKETGTAGTGARFEIRVPPQAYRIRS